MENQLLYSLLARKRNTPSGHALVLSEFTRTTGNFQTVTRRILEKIPDRNNKMSFSYDNYLFHIVVDDGIIFLCMCKQTEDAAGAKRLPFAFLDALQQKFKSMYGQRALNLTPNETFEDFSQEMRKQMEVFNKRNPNDKVAGVKQKVDEVKDIMHQNIDMMLSRGEKLNLLVDKTDQLADESFTFKSQAHAIKSKMWWRNLKMTLMIAIPVLVLILILLFWICGGVTLPTCVGEGEPEAGGAPVEGGGGEGPA